MPLKKAKGRSKRAINKAVGQNIREMEKANKKRSPAKRKPKRVIVAASERAARGK